METIWKLLEEAVTRHANRTLLVMRRGYVTTRWSYAYLRDFSVRVAAYLTSIGLKPGDRILVWSPNTPEWVGLYFGSARTGTVLVPLDVRIQPDFIRKVQVKSEAAACFVAGDLRASLPELGIPVYSLENLCEATAPGAATLPSAPQPEDIAEIMFTSGTTGEPKGVMLTHRNIVSSVRSATAAVPGQASYRLLSILPLSHMFEQSVGLLAPLSSGGMVVYPQSLQPGLIFRTLQEYRITTIALVPQVLRLFWDGVEREVAKQDKTGRWRRALKIAARLPMPARRLLFRRVHQRLGGHLRFFMCGGAHLDPELGRNWELLGVEVLQGYGTTEAAPAITTNRHRGRKLHTCGTPLPGVDVRIADDGEVLVRGPNVTPGYWRDEQATAAAFEAGWYRTGDLGSLDADGHLRLHGRKKDMIVLDSGFNVYAQDVEAVLNSDPRVKDSCVVAVPDSTGRPQVHAVLLLRTPEEDPQSIVSDANGKLNSHQRMRAFTIWAEEDFPRTHTLKIKKREVIEKLRALAAASEGPRGVQERSKNSMPDASNQSGARPKHDAPDAVSKIVASVTEVPASQIRPDQRLEEDLRLDSLGRVALLSEIEAELGVYVDESEIGPATSIGELDTLVRNEEGNTDRPAFPSWPLNRAVCVARTAVQELAALPALRTLAPPTVTGRENLAGLTGPVVFAANHQSHLDTPTVLGALPRCWRRRTAVAAAADFWFDGGKLPGYAVAFLFNAFPFSRSGAVRPTLEHCARLIERGWSVLIFPEGTRSPDGQLGQFKSGAGLIAVELGVPVVPVRLEGTFEVLSRHQRWPRRGRVHIAFGSPLSFERESAYPDATVAIRDAVARLAKSQAKHATLSSDRSGRQSRDEFGDVLR